MEDESYFAVRNDWLEQAVGRTELLGGISATERAGVLRVALGVAEQATAELNRYPAVAEVEAQTVRIPAVAIACVAMIPDLGRRAQVDLTLLELGLYVFDDILDRVLGGYRIAELTSFAADCLRAAAGMPTGRTLTGDITDETVVMIGDSSAALRSHPPAAWHYDYYLQQLTHGVDAGVQELAWQADHAKWPDYSQYLANGGWSCFGPATVAVLLNLLGPTAPLAEHTGQLQRVAWLVGRCIRLYNDLRSAEREKLDGTPNAVLILCRGSGLSQVEAAARILIEADRYLAELVGLLDTVPTTLREVVGSTVRLVQFARDWYLARELHGFTVDELVELTDELPGESAA